MINPMMNTRRLYMYGSLTTIKEELGKFDPNITMDPSIKEIPQMNYYNYKNRVKSEPPYQNLSLDPLTQAGIKDTTLLQIVSNHGYLASKIGRVRGYMKADLSSNRGLLIRIELSKNILSIRAIASRLGLSQSTVREFIRELFIRGFIQDSRDV